MIEIVFDRVGGQYCVGERVSGTVRVVAKGQLSHQGLTLECGGVVSMTLTGRAVGLLDAFAGGAKPIELFKATTTLAKPGKFPEGVTTLRFEFDLQPKAGGVLYESYHGVYLSIQYGVVVEMPRGTLHSRIREHAPFLVVNPAAPKPSIPAERVKWEIAPADVQHRSRDGVPKFAVDGYFDSLVCVIDRPLRGGVTIHTCETNIRSIELQLLRVEFVRTAEGTHTETTEIQNIQVGDGNVMHGVEVPLHMVFPRWFTCPTVAAQNFSVDFRVYVNVLLDDGHQLVKQFPLTLHRAPTLYRGPP